MEDFSPAYPAPAKLNLMLRVTGRRADGYHLLQTVFRLIDYGDTLRFRVREDGCINRVNDIAGVPADTDLCVRAARALQALCGIRQGVDIHLEKRLPMGGGLGGGSSDAATTLMALNHLWGCGLNRHQVIDFSVKIGADLPVFVFGRNALAEGIGEELQALELPPAWYVVLCPPVMVPTLAVFTHPELKRDSKKVKIQGFSEGAQAGSVFVNDLQPVVEREYPEVARHRQWLADIVRSTGCGNPESAMMTGSGACVFAPFASEADAKRVLGQKPASMTGFVARGLERHPLHDLLD